MPGHKHRRFVLLSVFQRWRELLPPSSTVHSQQHRGKYSPNNQWKQQRIVSICVFYMQRELFPFSWWWWQLKCIKWLSGSWENYRRTANSNALLIIASLTVYYLFFYQRNHRWTAKNLEDILKNLVRNEIFKVNLPRESV
jgi:hypothetical protein